MHTPLRVEIELETPLVIPDRPIALDSLLALSAVQTATRAGHPTPYDAQDDLELAEYGSGETRIWKASQLEIEYYGRPWWYSSTRRFELSRWAEDHARGYWAGHKNSIPAGTGQHRGFLMHVQVCWARKAVAWCVGDIDFVQRQLTDEIPAVGRNRRMGWGRVREVHVRVAPKAEEENWRRRDLPIALEDLRLPGHHRGTATLRPPYWDRTRWQEAWEYSQPVPPPSLKSSQDNP